MENPKKQAIFALGFFVIAIIVAVVLAFIMK